MFGLFSKLSSLVYVRPPSRLETAVSATLSSTGSSFQTAAPNLTKVSVLAIVHAMAGRTSASNFTSGSGYVGVLWVRLSDGPLPRPPKFPRRQASQESTMAALMAEWSWCRASGRNVAGSTPGPDWAATPLRVARIGSWSPYVPDGRPHVHWGGAM